MNLLMSLSIARRTAVVMGLLMGAMVIVALLALSKFKVLTDSMLELAGSQVERIELSQRWDANIREAVARWHTLSLAPDPALFAQVKEVTLQISTDTTRVQKRFLEIESSDEGKALGQELGEARARWLAERDAVRQAIEGGDMAGARALGEGRFAQVSKEYLAVSARHAGYQLERARLNGSAAESSARQQLTMLLGVTVVCLLAGAALAVAFVRSLMKPIGEAVRVAERIAEGDLSAPIHVTGRDEMARMLAAMHTMQERLRELIGGIGQSAQGLVVASGEIAQGNADTCPSAPSSRPARCSRPPARWKRSSAPSARRPAARATPATWRCRPARPRAPAARS